MKKIFIIFGLVIVIGVITYILLPQRVEFKITDITFSECKPNPKESRNLKWTAITCEIKNISIKEAQGVWIDFDAEQQRPEMIVSNKPDSVSPSSIFIEPFKSTTKKFFYDRRRRV